jgi:hypothetical protein
MQITINKTHIEKIAAIILLFVVFLFVPYRILNFGFMPTDDANRHVAFSVTDRNWTDVLEIEPNLSADHNAGWHYVLKKVHKYLGINKEALLKTVIISLFLIFNLVGTLLSPNIASWIIVMLLIFVFDRSSFIRLLLGRPFIISFIVTLILFKLWFIEPKKQISSISKYLISIFFISLAVWLHGTWYTFLLLPVALLLSGKVTKSFELCLIVLLSTVIGAYLTGEFEHFLRFHYEATLNIFTEKIYNWQLVTEFAEGNIYTLWFFPTSIIIILLIYSKKLCLNELSKDSLFIMILLCWMLSIKVVRFWVDWGAIALMFWLSNKISYLIEDMQSVKKPFFRCVLFVFTVLSFAIIIPNSSWNNQKDRKSYSVDFSKPQFADYKPLDGGIIYNDSMNHFYYQYFADPEGKYKYILGFEPAIMPQEDRKIFREIIYSLFHYSSYKPWIDKLTEKDRIFVSYDISSHYPQLDWIKAGKHLWIGKINNIKHEQ